MKKNIDTFKEFSDKPVGSTVAIQCEDSGPWTHGTLMSHGDHNHNNRPYKVQLTKTSHVIVRNSTYVKTTTTRAHQYLQEQEKKSMQSD